MKIRMAEREDMAEWFRMRDALWPGQILADFRSEAEAMLANTARAAVFVAVRDDDKLGGFLQASIRTDYVEGCDSHWVGYIEGWYVDPDLRQQRIGADLVSAAEKWAIGRGCYEMASDSELANNASLQAHLALGYDEVGRTIHFRKALPH